ncbi:hypothetical protein EYM_06775 [Ignicoccus islandicus DSM 13165]|uniref:Fumarate lyase N-terminal domain-containing protein n=1 Tax=Ignicoccus islandicus DSM 13165 TaxID=940295 RepID=A0A0U3FQX3_9CREN|nr:lyase family protein [Ignicoccus islandicus]ALU12719.1 hypothetical protein EYM_06775 [Ignicoccus islandicus DSM 13165]
MREQYRSYALGTQPKWLSEYISSIDFDLYICEYVLDVLREHVKELRRQGYVSENSEMELIRAIDDFDCTARLKGYEDVHEAIEYFVSKLTNAGKWLNLGKSRNDQVATALRARNKEEILDAIDSIRILILEFLSKASAYEDVPFPTFTHFQHAQPTTFGHYLLSFAEELVDLIDGLKYAYEISDLCPYGSAAVAGSTVRLDRIRVCKNLKFKNVAFNTIYATTSRNFILVSLDSISQVTSVLLRFIEDMFLYSNPALNLVEVPSSHAGTSSIMPHKRNPATLEIARAELLKVYFIREYAYALLKGLPSGYALDLQQLSPVVWEAYRTFRRSVTVISDFVREVEIGDGIKDIWKYPLRAADLAEAISVSKGVPFRDAYATVARGLKEGKSVEELSKEVLGIELPDPITSRRNAGSPGNLDPIKRKVIERLRKIICETSARWNELI